MDSVRISTVLLIILVSITLITAENDNKKYEVPNAEAEDAAFANNTDYENTDDGYFKLVKPQKIFVFMLNNITVVFNYSIPCDNAGEQLLVSFRSLNKEVFEIDGNSSVIIDCDVFVTENASLALVSLDTLPTTFAAEGSLVISINGKLIGLSSVVLTVTRLLHNSDNTISDTAITDGEAFQVAVMRTLRPIDRIFQYVIMAFLLIINIGFGCKLDLGIVKECLKKPVAPAIGLFCQYVIMPMIGFSIAMLAPLPDRSIGLGIFMCSICPGGGASNIYAYLLDGDISLSITMTVISTVASIGMMPLYIYTLGTIVMYDEYHISIPYLNIVQTLAVVVVPLLVGVGIKLKCPHAALRIIKILKPVMLVCVIILITVTIYSNIYIFQLLRLEHMLAGCCLPYFGYIFGGLIAAIFRQPRARVITIALETGMQNVGIALLLILMSLPPPLGDLTTLGPVASGITTPIPALLVTIVYLLYKKCCKKYEPVADDDQEIKVNGKQRKPDGKPGQVTNGNGQNEKLILEKLSSV